MTNWRGMQVPVVFAKVDGQPGSRGGVPAWVDPKVKPRYLAMGSWTPRKLRRK